MRLLNICVIIALMCPQPWISLQSQPTSDIAAVRIGLASGVAFFTLHYMFYAISGGKTLSFLLSFLDGIVSQHIELWLHAQVYSYGGIVVNSLC